MKKLRLLSSVFLALFILLGIVFVVQAFRSQLIPLRLGLIIILMLAIAAALIGLMIFRQKNNNTAVIFGGVLSLIFCVLLIIATSYVLHAVRTTQSISSGETELSAVSVYMLDENAELDASYQYGILKVQDRENTDHVINKLNEELKQDITIREYESLSALVKALYDHEVDAIIINSGFLDLIEEIPGYENAAEELKEISKIHVEKEVAANPTPAPQATETGAVPTDALPADDHTITLYISGIDNRGGLIEKSRSDVNIVAVANTETKQVLLVSTPRDYYVPLPISNGMKDKLTHAGIYGVDVSMGTLEMLYDIKFDYYFRVNFDGFLDIIDALGGVTVISEREYANNDGPSFVKGENFLKGYAALSFVRDRTYIGDQQRGRNQMALIKGVIEKATSKEILLSFNSVLDSVEGSFQTSIPYDVISALVRDQLDSGGDWNVVMYAVTGTGISAIPYSMNEPAFVMVPDMDTVQTAKDMIQQVHNGEILVDPNAVDAP